MKIIFNFWKSHRSRFR